MNGGRGQDIAFRKPSRRLDEKKKGDLVSLRFAYTPSSGWDYKGEEELFQKKDTQK